MMRASVLAHGPYQKCIEVSHAMQISRMVNPSIAGGAFQSLAIKPCKTFARTPGLIKAFGGKGFHVRGTVGNSLAKYVRLPYSTAPWTLTLVGIPGGEASHCSMMHRRAVRRMNPHNMKTERSTLTLAQLGAFDLGAFEVHIGNARATRIETFKLTRDM